ncbi:hypothetical protein Tco_1131404 [Tanacetum coccineum]
MQATVRMTLVNQFKHKLEEGILRIVTDVFSFLVSVAVLRSRCRELHRAWPNHSDAEHLLVAIKMTNQNEDRVIERRLDDVYFAFGRHLDELHVTWAHLEKKRTRLQTNTKTLEDLCSQSLETASQAIHDAVTTHQEIENLKVHAKRLFGNENVWIEMHRNITWDKVENPNPQSTPQVPPSFEEYTSPVTYPKEVEKTLGTPIEVEPLNELKLEEVGLNCNHNTPLSSREVPSFDGPKLQPLLNSPSLDVSLGDIIGPKPPIKPHSPDSSRMKVVDYLTTQIPPSPHMANSHPKGVYSYYNPGINDPKRHYGFKLGLLGKSVSLGVDISNWEMFDDDWGLESKEVSPLGEELSLFGRPNEVKRGRILEAHRLEPILQQQISQRMAPSHHHDCGDGVTINTRLRDHNTCDRVTPILTDSNAQVILDEKKLGSS